MVKRLAAAVLLAVVNLLNPAGADATDIDADDGAVEYRKARGTAQQPDALTLASQACDESLDAAWIVRGQQSDRPAAAVTVRHAADHVAVVTLAVRADSPAWAGVLGRALAFCRDEDALKVIVEVDGVAPAPVRSVAESCGFQFARMRRADGADVVECYTDLYWTDANRPA